MDTIRVDRPLRIAWAVQSGDRGAFIEQIVELFRADMVVAVGDAQEVKEFPNSFPHLIDPFLPSSLFMKDMNLRTRARVLDMHNAFYHWRNTPEWKSLC